MDVDKMIPVPREEWASISIPYELYTQWVEAENTRVENIMNPSEELQKKAKELGMTVEQLLCPSTHGGSGYSPGTSWTPDGNLQCVCGYVIVDPPSFGGRTEYRGFFRREERQIPDWGWLGSHPKAVKRWNEKHPERANWHRV